MNKLKKFSICLFGGIVLISTSSFARTGTVNAPNGLVLRETASKSAKSITTVGDDATVEILEENGEWYKVKYRNYEGYMFSEYVEAEEIIEETPKVEEEPVKENSPIQEENSQVVEQSQENSNGAYLQNVVVNTNIKIYLIPSVTSKVIANAEQNKTITINYEVGDWLNITYEGTTGWIRKYYINTQSQITNNNEDEQSQNTGNNNLNTNNSEEENKTQEQNNSNQQVQNNTTLIENKKGYINVSTSANIRESASTSANIINTLLRNTEVTIIGEEGDFYKIQYIDITGYVSKSLISDKPV